MKKRAFLVLAAVGMATALSACGGGSGGSTTVLKYDSQTNPVGSGSSAIIPGDNNPDTAIIMHANASAG